MFVNKKLKIKNYKVDLKKFDIDANYDLVREFERENHILLDTEKQVNKEVRNVNIGEVRIPLLY